eukprot:c1826_g1_i1.p1 GENE.c1826_g1_i1~~c1826_g1_i1.p1  ORF type:complete len:400 (-),score=106.49 c1826_g1_i1:31-1230(-)
MSLNIGGSEDAFFRYKMPDIEVKIEGRGNGIKTVIPNMVDIGLALKRDPAYPTKFFATELGALSKWDDKRNVGIVNGEHSKDTLKKLLADFINRYVLCPQCKLPETDLKVKNGLIHAKCKACGFRGLSDNQHKLATFIINHPPNKEAKDKEKDKSGKKDKEKEKGKEKEKSSSKSKPEKATKKSETKEDSTGAEGTASTEPVNNDEKNGSDGAQEEEDGEADFEITEEMLQTVAIHESAELEDPVTLARDLLDSIDQQPIPQQLSEVKKFQQNHGFDDSDTFQYIFKACVTDSMLKQVKSRLGLLSKLLSPGRDSQTLVLSLIEQRCEEFPDNLKDVAATLSHLYDNDILEEDVVLHWHEKGISQLFALADDTASRATRKAADKFVEWLQNAEEESEEE